MVPDEADDAAIVIYAGLLRRALQEIRSTAATCSERTAWARVAAFALERLPDTDERVAETLSTAGEVLDSPEAVQLLIQGIWSCTGCRSCDGTGARLRRWVTALADRALQGEHWATFARLAHTAIRIDGVERDLAPGWERGLRAAHEIPSTWVSLYLFSFHYARRYAPDTTVAPEWLRLLSADDRLREAFDRADAVERSACPACGRMEYP